jgi:hypothetical protein
MGTGKRAEAEPKLGYVRSRWFTVGAQSFSNLRSGTGTMVRSALKFCINAWLGAAVPASRSKTVIVPLPSGPISAKLSVGSPCERHDREPVALRVPEEETVLKAGSEICPGVQGCGSRDLPMDSSRTETLELAAKTLDTLGGLLDRCAVHPRDRMPP